MSLFYPDLRKEYLFYQKHIILILKTQSSFLLLPVTANKKRKYTESRKVHRERKTQEKNAKIIDGTLPFSTAVTQFPLPPSPHSHHLPHCGGGILSDTSNTPLTSPPSPGHQTRKNRWMRLPPYSHCIFRTIERR